MKCLVAFIVLFTVPLSAPTWAQQIQTFGKIGTVHLLSDATLTSKQRRHFQQFKKERGYFSYFYIAKNEDHSFAASHFHSREDAQRAGEVGCPHFSKSKTAKCIPYAVSLPKGVNLNTAQTSGISSKAYKVFVGKYPRNIKSRKGWGAFAISGGFDFGWATGKATKEEAADTAKQFCLKSVSKTLAGVPFEFRKWAKRNGHGRCNVVHTAHAE